MNRAEKVLRSFFGWILARSYVSIAWLVNYSECALSALHNYTFSYLLLFFFNHLWVLPLFLFLKFKLLCCCFNRVEFADVHRLNDGQVKHSSEAFYAGSFWKVCFISLNSIFWYIIRYNPEEICLPYIWTVLWGPPDSPKQLYDIIILLSLIQSFMLNR